MGVVSNQTKGGVGRVPKKLLWACSYVSLLSTCSNDAHMNPAFETISFEKRIHMVPSAKRSHSWSLIRRTSAHLGSSRLR